MIVRGSFIVDASADVGGVRESGVFLGVAGVLIDRRILGQFDLLTFGLAVLIPALGLVVLFSAGYDPDKTWQPASFLPAIPSQAFGKQFVFLSMGILILFGALFIPPSLLSKVAYPSLAVCIFLLILVDLFGSIRNGSQRWLDIGPFSIQPGEPTKFAVIVALARYISRNPPKLGGYSLRELIVPLLIFLTPAALIMIQPDLGTAMVILAIGGGMILFAGIRWRVLVIGTVLVLASLYPAWSMLHDYQKRRIQVLINPGIDPRGSGYHISQSKIAVGSGALMGRGYMRGTQSHLEFLPEHTTDFIYSVLAEEWGFIGCIVVLALYAGFLMQFLRIINRSKDLFAAVLTLGVGILIFFHAIVNIGMVIGLFPVVGIPLPLFSYGGSSMLSCLGAIGVVLGLDMKRLVFTKKF